MMRRSVLGALVGSVALAVAGVGSAVAIQRAHPAAPREEAVQVASGDPLPQVTQPSTTSVATTSVPTTAAPAAAATTTTKPRSVGTTVPVSVATAPRTTPPRPPKPSGFTGSTVTLPLVPPTTVPFVANIRHCIATPSTIEVAYNQAVSVHISFSFDMYAGSPVYLRDDRPGENSLPRVPARSTVDATGRGADFLLSVTRSNVDGVLEPAGTPHTFFMDDWDCSVRLIPH
jgi:hypothetical protein